MSQIYTYTKVVDIEQLWAEIEAVVGVGTILSIQQYPGNEIGVEFPAFITTEQNLAMDDVVANHVPAPEVDTTITKLQFRMLYTPQEKVLLDTSAEPVIVVIRNDFEAASFINLADPATIHAMSLIRDLGIITDERMNQILSNTPPSV